MPTGETTWTGKVVIHSDVSIPTGGSLKIDDTCVIDGNLTIGSGASLVVTAIDFSSGSRRFTTYLRAASSSEPRINVTGCASLSGATMNFPLSDSDLDSIGNTTKTVALLEQGSTCSSNTGLALKLSQPTADCRKAKVTSQTGTSSTGRKTLAAIFAIDDSACTPSGKKSSNSWIIAVVVVAVVVVLVVVAGLVIWFVPSLHEKVLPFQGSSTKSSTTKKTAATPAVVPAPVVGPSEDDSDDTDEDEEDSEDSEYYDDEEEDSQVDDQEESSEDETEDSYESDETNGQEESSDAPAEDIHERSVEESEQSDRSARSAYVDEESESP